ncbi:hepatic lectin-like [Mytilus galloprovincialis]|uniref:hepatic lectin-like n=1 Tax=Mytilus galloprovincialis TaxID=29158 RepID=UPI003F7B6124
MNIWLLVVFSFLSFSCNGSLVDKRTQSSDIAAVNRNVLTDIKMEFDVMKGNYHNLLLRVDNNADAIASLKGQTQKLEYQHENTKRTCSCEIEGLRNVTIQFEQELNETRSAWNTINNTIQDLRQSVSVLENQYSPLKMPGKHIDESDDLTRCPPILPRNSNLFAYIDTCLEIVHDERSWYDARRHCQQHGGDLAVIKDLTKQQFVMNALKYLRWDKNGVWIGGTDGDKEGEWKWVTEEKMTWGYWKDGQGVTRTGSLQLAKGYIEDCAQIRVVDSYKWHDKPCSFGPAYQYSSICEYNML